MKLQHPIKISVPFRILLSIPVPWVFILTYLVGLAMQLILPLHLWPDGVLFYGIITGVILFNIGVVVATWSLIIFRKAHTTTTPGENSSRLITSGPYRFSRNPMYVSLIFAYLGEAGFLSHAWPIIVFPLVVAYVDRIVIPLEEKILLDDFKTEYENYCSSVRRWF
jgi:protein-S-isoprenylcysteine O-methyltransferase Ste14